METLPAIAAAAALLVLAGPLAVGRGRVLRARRRADRRKGFVA